MKQAFRQARRHPGYSLVCIAVLAFGLAANTTVFSVFYSAILKPLPYPQPDRLVAVHNRFPQLHLSRLGASPLDYVELREQHDLFSEVGAFYFLDLTRTAIEHPVKVNAVAATSSLFRTFGVQPLYGRLFTADEERPNGPHAVLLSEGYWRNQFAADPQILSRAIQLDGERYAVAGVMPESFAFPNDVTEMWVPVVLRASQMTHDAVFLRMYARLAPGVSPDQASTWMEQLSQLSARDHPDARRSFGAGWRRFVQPMATDDDGTLRHWAIVLMAAVICLLLIVCSNVAGLMLARSAERQFEFSIRLALGAGRLRIARQLVLEVLLLSIAAGAAGLFLARESISWISEYAPGGKLQFEAPVFWFGTALSLVIGAMSGLYPAWSAIQMTGQRALIVIQVALSTALLLCGGLFLHSLTRLLEIPLGFDPKNVLSMEITLPGSRYPTPEARGRFFSALLESAARIPGVEAVSGCTNLPFGYGESVNSFEIAGQPKFSAPPFANLNIVLPRYFETLRIPLLRGRSFTPDDRPGSEPVVLIDETLASRFFTATDPIGQRLTMPWGTFTIAGVVGRVKNGAREIEGPPEIYFSAEQKPSSDSSLVIRSNLAVNTITQNVQRIITRIDADEPVYDVIPLQTFIDRSVRTRRFVASLISVFAVASVGLAALGLFGLLSHMIARRRRELGIRIAIGASARAIALLVCRGAMALVLSGVALGAVTALAARRWIASQLYGVSFGDASTWIGVIAVVIATGALACAAPAWRAARTDPIKALR